MKAGREKGMETGKQEKIGKVTLDYEFYPGEDVYCDGAIEDTLLEIVKEHPYEEDYEKIITDMESWPVLYHLSGLRGNIVSWIPMDKDTKVLEVGSGCGAITGTLAKKAGSVTCVDLSKKRSTINAYRNSTCENVRIHVGNFKDIEPTLAFDYDYILLIGVFEYGQSYIGGSRPYQEFLTILLRHLKQGGRLIIAIENKFGLKYWAGCREDHLGTYFSGLEDYRGKEGVRTFTQRGLARLLKLAGVRDCTFYYPYPDYKFMNTLYSERRLPKEGELSDNHRNFDMDRLMLFDEQAVFDTVIREKEFALFSNSYLVMTGEPFDGQELEVCYSRFSNERKSKFCIRTDIMVSENGKKFVFKYPMTEQAAAHVDRIEKHYKRLSEENTMPWLHFVPSKAYGDCMASPFIEGESLLDLLQREIAEHREQEAKVMLLDFIVRFRQYYKERETKEGGRPLTDLDFVFSNILVDGDDWYIIDYEWSFEAAVPEDYVLFRALFRASIELPRCGLTELSNLLSLAGITEEEGEAYRCMEEKFQAYIGGGRVMLRDMAERFGKQVIYAAREKNGIEREAERMINLHGTEAVKLFYSLDRCERIHGRACIAGWACAKIRGGGFIPVHITIFDEDGNTMEQAVRRMERPDVMEVLKAKGSPADCCGFEAVFGAGEKRSYRIRFFAGKCLKEVNVPF